MSQPTKSRKEVGMSDRRRMYHTDSTISGVFIEDTNGDLHESAERAGYDYTPRCIAIITPEHEFGIHYGSISGTDSDYSVKWFIYDTTSLTVTTDLATAKLDLNGRGNTNTVANLYNPDDESNAMDWAVGWGAYIGSVGEWNLVNTNLSKVNSLINGLTSYGRIPIPSGSPYWTSTSYSSSKAWTYNASSGGKFSQSYVSSAIKVRAFLKLKKTHNS